MNEIIYRNLANAIVAFRVFLLFVLIILLENASAGMRIIGLILLVVIALLDWVDGLVAEKCGITSKVGGMLDTLGDRITENLLFVFFAYKQVIPLYVPLFFITRSFLADFIRSLNLQKGIGTFTVHTSRWGRRLVSSRVSRVLYLCMKIAVFIFCTLFLVMQSMKDVFPDGAFWLIQMAAWRLALATVLFSLCRFFLLVFDSREVLKESFLK